MKEETIFYMHQEQCSKNRPSRRLANLISGLGGQLVAGLINRDLFGISRRVGMSRKVRPSRRLVGVNLLIT